MTLDKIGDTEVCGYCGSSVDEFGIDYCFGCNLPGCMECLTYQTIPGLCVHEDCVETLSEE